MPIPDGDAEDLSPALGGPGAPEAPGPSTPGTPSGPSAEAGTDASRGNPVRPELVVEAELGALVEAFSSNLGRALEQVAGAMERELPQALDRLGRQVPDAAARLEAQLPQALGAIERLANVFEAAFTPLVRPVAEAVDRMAPAEDPPGAPPRSAGGAPVPPAPEDGAIPVVDED